MSDADGITEGLEAAEAFDHMALECSCHSLRDQAVEYRRRALAVRERVLGPDHYEVANSLIILAGMMEESDQPKVDALTRRAADNIYERAIGRLGVGGEQGGETFARAFHGLLGALGNLAGAAWRRGDLAEAEAGYRAVLDRFESVYGPDYGYIHPTLPGFARLLVRRGKADEAEARLRAALAGGADPDGWTVTDCEEALAELCLGSGRRAEAEGLYRSAVGRRERTAQNGWPASAGAAAYTLRRLAGLCRGTGRTGEADELDRRAADWERRRSEAIPWEP